MRPRSVNLVIASAALASIGGALLGGCGPRKVRVDVVAGEDGVTRTFATNQLDAEELARVQELYGAAPVERDGEIEFTAAFAEDLPSEVGNRNGLSEVRTSLGSSHFYWESFDAGGDHWRDLEHRIDCGDLWICLFGRWAETRIDDESRREEFKAALDGEYRPLARDVMLMWSAMQAASQAQRVAARVRTADDRSPMTRDESYRRTLFLPLLLLLSERGIFTAEETQRLLLLSTRGNPDEMERRWSFDELIMPAILRQVRRFMPEATPPTFPQLLASGVSFYLFATSSAKVDDILLASPVVSDADKERIRRGERGISLPPAFGFRVGSRPKVTETEVSLATGVEPYLTNGTYEEERKAVIFRSRVVAGAERTSLYPPTFQAAWAVPDEARQRQCFGEVLLAGEDLASYCGWWQVLTPKLQERWEKALETLASGGGPGALREVASQLRLRHPVPRKLAEWLAQGRT